MGFLGEWAIDDKHWSFILFYWKGAVDMYNGARFGGGEGWVGEQEMALKTRNTIYRWPQTV